MELSLPQNIRRFRKERKLTQEQLAAAMGVTPGAVYKWESGQSTPELHLIAELADFFGTSTDVLIGYQWQSRSAVKTLQEIQKLRKAQQYEQGTAAVQKALQNYPNDFEIIYESALLFCEKAAEQQIRSAYESALKLFDRACELLGQNKDESISELSIRNQMAQIHFKLGHIDTCMEILKHYNFCGMNNATIGCILADSYHRTEEAKHYLTEAFGKLVKDLDSVVIGFTTIFLHDGDYEAILSGVEWLRALLQGGEMEDHVTWSDKYECVLLAIEAEICCMMGDEDRAKENLTMAAKLAKRFDSTQFSDVQNPVLLQKLGAEERHYMEYGQTALDVTQKRVMTDAEIVPQLPVLWKKVKAEVLQL